MPTMEAWAVHRPGPIDQQPLRRVQREVPVAGPGQVLLRVLVCALCRTDLHLAEGELAPKRPDVVPGHQVVGEVVACGPGSERFRIGDRVGIAWLAGTCGRCDWCRDGRENLCPNSIYTGWDVDGGYAEYAVANEAYAHPVDPDRPAEEIAPLLCAGIIGYRALRRAQLPDGGRLGLWGFGSSAHLTAQLALAQGARLSVFTRGEAGQRLATRLGADEVGGSDQARPASLDAAIVFAPAGGLVPAALTAVKPGGTVCLAGVHMSEIPAMDYDRLLFGERDLRSVAANTRADAAALLGLSRTLTIRPEVRVRPFGELDRALADLAHGGGSGSTVISVGSSQA